MGVERAQPLRHLQRMLCVDAEKRVRWRGCVLSKQVGCALEHEIKAAANLHVGQRNVAHYCPGSAIPTIKSCGVEPHLLHAGTLFLGCVFVIVL